MDKPGLLPIIEAQITQWDCGLSERARDFFRDMLITAKRTGNPPQLNAMKMPCSDVASMARACLIAFTNYSEEDFETVSDCLHMRSGMARHTASPHYVEALLDVLASCLYAQEHIEDGCAELAANEIPELVQRLEALEREVASRYWLEKDLHAAAKTERGLRADFSAKQREKAQKLRTADVQRIVERLAREPSSAKQLWPHFVSALEDQGMSPVEGELSGQPYVNYEPGETAKRMTFKAFSNRLSKARNPNTRG